MSGCVVLTSFVSHAVFSVCYGRTCHVDLIDDIHSLKLFVSKCVFTYFQYPQDLVHVCQVMTNNYNKIKYNIV